MPVDPVGIAIGLGGILLAFKGVVDTVNLFDLIVSSDNGSKHLALKYQIERYRLKVWGDEFTPATGAPSSLATESQATRMLIAGILAEIRATHDLMEKYIPRYNMESTIGAEENTEGDGLSIQGAVVSRTKEARDRKTQKRKAKWGIQDKQKVSEIVQRMESLNNDLYSLARTDNTQALANALSAYLLPQIKDTLSLVALQQVNTTMDPLLVLSARIKQLNEAPDSETAEKAVWYDLRSNLKFDQGQKETNRETGYLERADHLDERVWVEWKLIGSNVTASDADNIGNRIEALAVLLSAATAPEFCMPPCKGIVEDIDYRVKYQGTARKLGYIYQWPSSSLPVSQTPRSLLQLLDDPNQAVPLLSDRFTLAYKLASSLSLLHASKWLHKSFRSDNVLFFAAENGQCDICKPYITGFEYSRPEGTASIDARPVGQAELNVYYHPDVSLHGFDRVRDLYSLGVVLFEVAVWMPMSEKINEDSSQPDIKDMTTSQIRDFLLAATDELGAATGPRYQNAVRLCLRGEFGIPRDDDGEELGRAFFIKVLKELSLCRA